MSGTIVKQILEQYLKNKNSSYFLRFTETVQMNHIISAASNMDTCKYLLEDFENLICFFPSYCSVTTDTVTATVIVANNK